MANQVEFFDANHISAAHGDFEVQRTNNFMLFINSPPGLQLNAATEEAGAAPGALNAGDINELIRKSLKAFPFPTETSEKIPIPYQNTERKVAGIVKYADVDLVIHDYFDQATTAKLFEWRRLIWVPSGAIGQGGLGAGAVGYARAYKSDGKLQLLGPGGETTTIREWGLYGIWPLSVDMGKGDMERGGKNEVKVTFCIDYITEVLPLMGVIPPAGKKP